MQPATAGCSVCRCCRVHQRCAGPRAEQKREWPLARTVRLGLTGSRTQSLWHGHALTAGGGGWAGGWEARVVTQCSPVAGGFGDASQKAARVGARAGAGATRAHAAPFLPQRAAQRRRVPASERTRQVGCHLGAHCSRQLGRHCQRVAPAPSCHDVVTNGPCRRQLALEPCPRGVDAAAPNRGVITQLRAAERSPANGRSSRPPAAPNNKA
jgi:hypothetical protein